MNSDPWADSSAASMDHHGNNPNNVSVSVIEDQRALQLALELSMLGLTTAESSHNPDNSSLMTSARIGSPLSPTFSFLNNHGGLLDNSHFSRNGHQGLCHHSSLLSSSSLDDTFRSAFGVFPPKKSQNMTECVPVPSSEHVAEIVGRQGCKIKALRAKTNTYIKTPVRGEEPVFVVTGRKEDVALAKREILSAADHFTQIRASRKGGSSGGLGSPSSGAISPTCAPAPIPGQITIQVRVPYRVVGLVVGPKGATIKRIQQQTHTYIVTPSRDKDPVFEVTGLPESVQMAKREIEAHIAIRTGSLPLDTNAIGEESLSASQTELLANLYKNGLSGLEALGLNFGLGLGLGAINSLSSSLSSVSGLGLGAVESGESGGDTVGSSSSGGGSLSSLSSLNGHGGTGCFGNGNIGNKDNGTPEGNNMFSSFFDYPSLLNVSALGLSHHMNEDGNGGCGGGNTVGSSSSGGGSLSSLSSLNGFNGNNNGGNNMAKEGTILGDAKHANNMFSPFFDYPSD